NHRRHHRRARHRATSGTITAAAIRWATINVNFVAALVPAATSGPPSDTKVSTLATTTYVNAGRVAFQLSKTAMAVPSTMHITIDVAHAPTGSVITESGSPNGSPTRSSVAVCRTIPGQADVA